MSMGSKYDRCAIYRLEKDEDSTGGGRLQANIDHKIDYLKAVASFTYTVSVFLGQRTSMISISEGEETYHLMVDCTDTTVDDFIARIVSGKEFVRADDVGQRTSGSFEYEFNRVSDRPLTIAEGTDILLCHSIEGDNTVLSLFYSDRFSAHTMRSFMNTLLNIVNGMKGGLRLSEINILCPAEITLLESYHGKNVEPSASNIVDVFRSSSVEYSGLRCISCDDESLTYAEVDAISDCIASELQSNGIGKGDHVGFLIPRCASYLNCTLGILKTGAAYVPFDADYPDPRILDCLLDSHVKCLLVNNETLRRAEHLGVGCKIINIDSCHGGKYNPVHIDGNDLFAIIYTTGTTGRPKGAMITHRGVINCIDEVVELMGAKTGEIGAMFVSIGFIAHVPCLHSLLKVGASLIMIPQSIRKDIKGLANYLNATKVKYTFVTPQVAKLISAMNISMEIVLVGGESVDDGLDTDKTLYINTYGLTEALSVVSRIPIRDRKYDRSVGFVVRNTKAYIIDGNGHRSPPGATGEICFSGPQISVGYINHPRHEAFIENTFCNEKGYEILFRTGDMGRFLPDGTIGFCDRRDCQVKIRGNRVELSEVDSAIMSLPGMKQCTVQAVDLGDSKELCAYVVAPPEITDQMIKDVVASKRPPYMVPSFIVRLQSIPMNINGKVDTSKLQMPDLDSMKAIYVAPRNNAERRICSAFSEVLGIKNVGIDDDFILLGGDSLKAMELQGALSEEITPADIMQGRTPKGIAALMAEHTTSLSFDEHGGCPLNIPQMNVFLDIQVDPSRTCSYEIPFHMEFDPTDQSKVERALREVIDAQPALRSHIVIKDDAPWMLFDSYPSLVPGDHPTDIDLEHPASFAYTDCSLDGRFLHTMFDGYSIAVLRKNIETVLAGHTIEKDDGVLYSSSFYSSFVHTEKCSISKAFYERMLSDGDPDHGLVCSPSSDVRSGSVAIRASINSPGIAKIMRTSGASKGIIYTSAFAYTLSRFNGRSDAIFCIAENGRFIPKTLGSIGMFVRTLPLRIDCSDSTVMGFLAKASDAINGSVRNGFLSMGELNKTYGVSASVMMQYAAGVDISASLDIKDEDISDLSAMVIEDDDEIVISLKHSVRFTDSFVRSIGETFFKVLGGLVTCERLSDIEIASNDDISLMDLKNRTERKVRYNSVIRSFKDNVSSHPDDVLVTYLGRKYTYAEADRITDGIAYALADKGVARGDNVAILVPRSEWYLLAAIAVLKTGAAYVPIDDSYPMERKAFMISDSSAKAMITSSSIDYATELMSEGSCIFVEDGIGPRREFDCATNDKDDTFAILYTSGTTGKPKGTLLRHINIISHLSTYVRTYKVTRNDVYSSYVSYGFDAVITGLFVPLVTGASVDIVPDDVRFDIDSLSNHYVVSRPTITELPASVCRLYLNSHNAVPFRLMTTGGEAIGKIDVPDGLDLEDTYGPTELFDYITYATVKEKTDPSSIGIPCDNSKVYILDRERRRVPYGAVGELYVSGLQVTGGYLNRDEETNGAFFDNPFVTDSVAMKGYGRMYRTGDFVRYLPDGTIGFLGRKDGQVKVRGNRVELTEVESVIRSITAVKAVTVQAIVNDARGKELCAYIVTNPSEDELTAEFVQSFVSERKPAYMVPSYVVFLEKIPLNVNGKVDRRALPKPDMSSSMHHYVAPRNHNEGIICRAMAETLGLERFGIDDDFIALGGDSLKAIKVQNIAKIFSTADILRYRSPRAICEHSKPIDYRTDLFSLETGCPLSESQLNVYLDILANEKKGAYVIPFGYDIPKGCTKKEAIKCIHAVISSHPILGAHIDDKDGEPWIVCGNEIFITDHMISPYDIDIEKCLSAFHISGNKIIAMISHIAFDGYSEELLTCAFDEAFHGADIQIDTGFLISSSFDASIRTSDRFARAKLFYDSCFCDIDCDTGLIDDIKGETDMHTLHLTAPKEKVDDCLRDNLTSAGAFFTSAFAYALSRFTGRSDSVFSIVDNGREIPGLENAIGMFVRTIPMHIDCTDVDVKKYLRTSTDNIYESLSNALYPFRLIHNDYGVKSDVIFQFMAGVKNSALTSSDITDVKTFVSNDLSMNVEETDDGYVLSSKHSSRYSSDTIERMMVAFDAIVTGLLECERLSDIQFTSPDDIAFQNCINETTCPVRYNDIIQAFRDSVTKYPDNKLVAYLDRNYTYIEVDRISDGIAHALTKKGIRKGDNVAILVQRSEWYLIAALAVLKTGATYVPVDEAYPDERISFMISDSSAKAILVTDITVARAGNTSDVPAIDVTNCAPSEFEGVSISKDDDSVVLYTSGTTGTPKGTQLTHGNICNYAEWFAREMDMDSSDVFPMYCSFGFDVHIEVFYSSIVCGATVDIIPDDRRLDIDALADYIVDRKNTVVHLPASIGKIFIPRYPDIPIRIMCVGGEKLGDIQTRTSYKLYDTYGPTEATVSVTYVKVSEKVDHSSIGRPLSNVNLYVLDKEGRRLPCGAIGELFVSGEQVAEGYLNNPDSNSIAFIDNPFDGYARMYATGDFVRYLPDGTLGIIGRRDGQVKIRGNRVELTEVESAIRSITAVKAVTVQAIVNEAGGKELCAYIVTNPSEYELTAEFVQSFVSERKPAYMVPSYVVFLDFIPLNVNGKVDRRALPKPDIGSAKKDYVAPRNEKERLLCKAMAETLGLDRVGIDDDFIALGGDSLKAIRMVSICRSYKLTIDVKNIISKRTVSAISSLTSEASDMGQYSGPIGLSPIQRSFLSTHVGGARDWYNQSVLLESKQGLDIDVLQKALDAVTDHHDMLRAVYPKDSGAYVREPGTSVCSVSHRGFSSESGMTEYMDSLQRSLSLDEGRLAAVAVLSLKGSSVKDYLFVTIHHMVVDGVSWSIIIDDITESYRALKDGNEPRLPPRTEPFGIWVGRDIPDEEKGFWRSKELVDIGEGACRRFAVQSRIDMDSLRGNVYGFETIDVLLSAFVRAYHDLTGDNDVTLKMEGHGRQLSDVGRTVGWFTDVYPLTIGYSDSLIEGTINAREAMRSIPNGGIGFGLTHADENVNDRGFAFNYLGGVFEFSNDMFETAKGISMGRMFDASEGVAEINITYSDDGLAIYGAVPESLKDLPNLFVKDISYAVSYLLGSKTFECPLTEPQLNIYLDPNTDKEKEMEASLIISRSKKDVTEEAFVDALRKALESVPCVNSRIEVRDRPYFVTLDSEIVIETHRMDETDIRDFIMNYHRPFDLTAGPMYHAAVCITDGNIHSIILFNHMFIDRLSITIFNERFESALAGKALEKDHGMFLQDPMDAYERSAAHDWFNRMLADANPQNLYPDKRGEKKSCSVARMMDVRKSDIPVGITPNAFITSAIMYALSRFTASENSTVTIVDNGRTTERKRDSVGLFIRILPISVNNDDDVSQYLSSVQDSILGTMEHGDYPFRLLAKEFGLNSNLLSINYHNDSMTGTGIENDVVFEDKEAISNLVLHIQEFTDGLGLKARFNSGIYSEGLVGSFVESISNIARNMLSHRHFSEFEFTSENDIALLDSFNSHYVTKKQRDVIGLFSEVSKERPDDIAVIIENGTMTYGELDRLSDIYAHVLVENGVRKGDLVPIFVPKSEYTAILPIAVLKAGAAYIPIDYTHPKGRVMEIIEESESKVIVASGDADLLNGSDRKVIRIEDVDESCHERFDPVVMDDDDLFAVLYTSGSTGRPKGVEITRGNIAASSAWFRRNAHMGPDTVFGFYVSFGFAPHYDSLFAPLTAGYPVAIVPEEMRTDMEALDAFIEDKKVTHIILPAAICGSYLSSRKLSSPKYIFAPGSRLPVLENDGIRIYCDYGQSECPNMVLHDISDTVSPNDIGIHTDATRLYILDGNGKRVPVGAVGEICVSGPMVSKGYRPKNVFDDSAFTIDVFSNDGMRMKHTGDIGRYLPNGHVELFGRKDGMVKIRGNRVEPGEVETAISQMEGVIRVTVQYIKEYGQLCAYVVTDRKLERGEIRAYISGKKPAYMVPSFIIFVDEIPLNVNGKVDRRALPIPTRDELLSEYVAPRNPAESLLCNLFESVLGIDRVGIDDDFVLLGGDSLKSVTIASRFNNNSVNTHLSSSSIMSFKTPRIIAENISLLSSSQKVVYTFETGCPFTDTQYSMYKRISSCSAQAFTNSYASVMMKTPLREVSTRQEAISFVKAIIARHPVLGGYVVQKDTDEPRLYFSDNIQISVIETNPETFDSEIEKYFDVKKDVLSRFTIVEWEGRYTIFLVACHLICDSLSLGILSKEFSMKPEALPSTVDDGIVRQASFESSFVRVTNSEKPQNIVDFTKDFGIATDYVISNMIVKKIDINQVKTLVDLLGTSTGYLAYSAFAYALCKVNKTDKCHFGVMDNGRGGIDLNGCVGFFAKRVPVTVERNTNDLISFVKSSLKDIYRCYNNNLPLLEFARGSSLYLDYFINYVHTDLEHIEETTNKRLHHSLDLHVLAAVISDSNNIYYELYHTKEVPEEKARAILDAICEFYDKLAVDMKIGKHSNNHQVE